MEKGNKSDCGVSDNHWFEACRHVPRTFWSSSWRTVIQRVSFVIVQVVYIAKESCSESEKDKIVLPVLDDHSSRIGPLSLVTVLTSGLSVQRPTLCIVDKTLQPITLRCSFIFLAFLPKPRAPIVSIFIL